MNAVEMRTLGDFMRFLLREMRPKGPILTPFNVITAPIMALGVVLILYRLVHGLGAVVGEAPGFPWGIWIGFNVMTGVAFAGGAYVLTFIVYILRNEHFHPIVRETVLNGFLAYLFYASVIFIDCARWWNIYNPLIGNRFGVNAVLFLIAWHFFLYMLTTKLSSRALTATPITMAVRTRACGTGSTALCTASTRVSASSIIGAVPPLMYPILIMRSCNPVSAIAIESTIFMRFFLVRTPQNPIIIRTLPIIKTLIIRLFPLCVPPIFHAHGKLPYALKVFVPSYFFCVFLYPFRLSIIPVSSVPTFRPIKVYITGIAPALSILPNSPRGRNLLSRKPPARISPRTPTTT